MGGQRTDDTEQPAHPVPWPSWILLNALHAIAASCHLILRGTPYEPIVATFLIGGLFGLTLPPVLLLYALARGLVGSAWASSVLLGFVVWYIAAVALDPAPRQPTGVGARRPRNYLESLAEKFWTSSFEYFPTTLILAPETEAALKDASPKKRFLFAVHPHGIHCWPLNLLGFPKSPFNLKFPRLRATGLCASVMFRLPVIREVFLWCGYVDASRQIAKTALKRGSIFLCTGGEREALATTQGVDKVVLKSRKGFVKLAIQAEADLVPVFGVGCSDLYTTYTFLQKPREWLQRTLAIALPIFHGRHGSPLPYRLPITVVLGKPIVVPKKPPSKKPSSTNNNGKPPPPSQQDNGEDEPWPTQAVIDETHARYIAGLQELHAKYAPEGRKLELL